MNFAAETTRMQVKAKLIQLLYRTSPGERLPAEQQLAQELHVSRATLRDVMSQLTVEGFIIRRQGSGTYVNRLPFAPSENLLYYVDFPTLISQRGYRPSMQQLDFQQQLADAFFSEYLDIPPGAAVLTRRCLYWADDHFCVLVEDSFPRDLLTEGQYAQLLDSQNMDLRFFLFSATGRTAYRDEMTISTVQAGQISALDGLVSPADLPILFFASSCFDKQNRPLICSKIFTDSRYIQYKMNRHIL